MSRRRTGRRLLGAPVLAGRSTKQLTGDAPWLVNAEHAANLITKARSPRVRAGKAEERQARRSQERLAVSLTAGSKKARPSANTPRCGIRKSPSLP